MTKPNPTHRKPDPFHDEKSRCIYHITLVVGDRDKVLGRMEGTCAEDAVCECSPLGVAVSQCIHAIPHYQAKYGRKMRIVACQIMPEHAHFCLFVEEEMDVKLGVVIKGLKQGCNKALRAAIERQRARESADIAAQNEGDYPNNEPNGGTAAMFRVDNNDANVASSPYARPHKPCPDLPITSEKLLKGHALFEDDFDRTPMKKQGQLDRAIKYVHRNPKTRWIKTHNPGLFLSTRGIEIAGRMYDAIGNIHLLGLDRTEVHVRRKFTEQERRDYMNGCILKARRNVVLVSPFISEWEKMVRDVALQEGHSVIQLVDNGFTDYTQVPGDMQEYCLKGQLLLLVPSEWPHIDRKKISREECVTLNGYAEEIVAE